MACQAGQTSQKKSGTTYSSPSFMNALGWHNENKLLPNDSIFFWIGAKTRIALSAFFAEDGGRASSP
jgi:hypothetical protein